MASPTPRFQIQHTPTVSHIHKPPTLPFRHNSSNMDQFCPGSSPAHLSVSPPEFRMRTGLLGGFEEQPLIWPPLSASWRVVDRGKNLQTYASLNFNFSMFVVFLFCSCVLFALAPELTLWLPPPYSRCVSGYMGLVWFCGKAINTGCRLSFNGFPSSFLCLWGVSGWRWHVFLAGLRVLLGCHAGLTDLHQGRLSFEGLVLDSYAGNIMYVCKNLLDGFVLANLAFSHGPVTQTALCCARSAGSCTGPMIWIFLPNASTAVILNH